MSFDGYLRKNILKNYIGNAKWVSRQSHSQMKFGTHHFPVFRNDALGKHESHTREEKWEVCQHQTRRKVFLGWNMIPIEWSLLYWDKCWTFIQQCLLKSERSSSIYHLWYQCFYWKGEGDGYFGILVKGLESTLLLVSSLVVLRELVKLTLAETDAGMTTEVGIMKSSALARFEPGGRNNIVLLVTWSCNILAMRVTTIETMRFCSRTIHTWKEAGSWATWWH